MDDMENTRIRDFRKVPSDERHATIRTFCRQQYPRTKTAARIDAQKAAAEKEAAAAEAAEYSPPRAAGRCRSPPTPTRDTRSRRSTCNTCATFARRDALRTASARARSVKARRGRPYDGTGSGPHSVLKTEHTLTSGMASRQQYRIKGTDPCDARLPRKGKPAPARGPERWHRRKCKEPTILKPTVSDVPWGGTPSEHLKPEKQPRIVRRHRLETRAKGSPDYWRQEFEKLEDQIRGPTQGVKQVWDALTPTILQQVAPILGIPMPTLEYEREDADVIPTEYTPPSVDKSGPIPYWDDLSLPDEIAHINVKPSDPAFQDWQFADIPERHSLAMFGTERASLRAMMPKPKPKGKGSVKIRIAEEEIEAEKVEKIVTVESVDDKTVDADTTVKESTQRTSRDITRETKTQKRLPTGRIIEVTEVEVTTLLPKEKYELTEPLRDSLNKEFVHVHKSFADIERELREEKEAQLMKAMRTEEEGEYIIREFLKSQIEGIEETERKEGKEPWGGELYITDSYLDARRAVIGSAAIEEEMSELLEMINVDLEVHPPTIYPRDEGLFTCPGRPDNPYFNFISKTPKRAAIWRETFRPETTGEAMDTAVLLHPDLNLPEKAKHVTKTITSEFVEWLRGLGGVQQTEMTEEVLQQLFDVTFDMPAARSLCVRVRELPVVTKKVAESCHAPQAEEQEALRLAVRKDLGAESRRQHLVAFQKMLERCCPQRFIVPRNKVRETWIECRVPQDLATSRIVFEGITQLISVQRFCEWLDNHPKFEAPEYLKRVGMVGPGAPHFMHQRAPSQSVRFTEGSLFDGGHLSRSLSLPGGFPRFSRTSKASRVSMKARRSSGSVMSTTRQQALSTSNLERLHKSLSAARSMAVL